MSVRKRILPEGWYPVSPGGTVRQIETWITGLEEADRTGSAGIVPHAGWFFSGEIACRVVGLMDKRADTVVVVGGHLPEGGGILAASEDEYETPLGTITADAELKGVLAKKFPLVSDTYGDNTVEIQLPFIKYFFPSAKALWLRAEHSVRACELGNYLTEAAAELSRHVVVLGSTDLTHYGSNYGYSPAGAGEKAVTWVKERNDKAFIDACLEMNCQEALHVSSRDRSACSAGGAAAAFSFAQACGITEGRVIEYRTSYDVQPSESFVGYVGLVYK